MADEAVHIGGSAPRDSYLVVDRILDAARRTGAQAIHPGYGFLSENAGFAEACAQAGIVFIGPPPPPSARWAPRARPRRSWRRPRCRWCRAITATTSRPSCSPSEAERIGFPVLIKASAGGGGKGMRVVESAAKFADAARRRQARGQGVVRRRSRAGREVPDAAAPHRDPGLRRQHGNCLYLFERDCSIQRRHQKVIEEAPAPNMDPARRKQMGEAAVAAAKAIGYVGRRHRRVHRQPGWQLLLHGDEHPPPGRASGDRDDHRPGPGRMAARRGGRRQDAIDARRAAHRRPSPSRSGSTPRTRRGISFRRPAPWSICACRRRTCMSASIPACARAIP